MLFLSSQPQPASCTHCTVFCNKYHTTIARWLARLYVDMYCLRLAVVSLRYLKEPRGRHFLLASSRLPEIVLLAGSTCAQATFSHHDHIVSSLLVGYSTGPDPLLLQVASARPLPLAPKTLMIIKSSLAWPHIYCDPFLHLSISSL